MSIYGEFTADEFRYCVNDVMRLTEISSGKSLYNLFMACYRYACEHIASEPPMTYYATKYCERDFILDMGGKRNGHL